jgi:apolipoprotein N-acyltransferase
MRNIKLRSAYFLGMVGSVFLFFIGWEYNIPLMGWIAFPLLMSSFRSMPKWKYTLPLLPLMVGVRFLSIHGGWDINIWMEIGFSIIVLIPLIAALYADRAYIKYLNPFLATLVFPCTYIILDYFLTYANLGMTFSLAYSQSTFLEFVQIASVLGSWFVGFVTAWFAPVAVLFVTNINRLKTVRKPLITYFTILSMIMLFGCFRLAFSPPQSQTVRIASITEEHYQDYWTITDKGTPRSEADKYKLEMSKIQEELFASSKKTADYGAKIIFWSEGNYPVYEDDYAAFLERAKNFAKENKVYFMPSLVVFLYDRDKNDNLAVMINPQGEVEYRYEKTISWYPSDSDGKIPVIDTPYGKLATAICFDMDYPYFISQAKAADIMLVPGFDTKKIADYHTRVSFLRGIENGFSVIRQANKGTSISADYLGNTLAYQKFFNTDSRIMITDAPIKGKWTFYGFLGEIFLCAVFIGFLYLNIYHFRKVLKGTLGNENMEKKI